MNPTCNATFEPTERSIVKLRDGGQPLCTLEKGHYGSHRWETQRSSYSVILMWDNNCDRRLQYTVTKDGICATYVRSCTKVQGHFGDHADHDMTWLEHYS